MYAPQGMCTRSCKVLQLRICKIQTTARMQHCASQRCVHTRCCKRCRFNASRDVAFYAFGDSSHLSLGSVTCRMKVVCRSFHLLQALPLERFQARLGLCLEVALHDETVLRRRTAFGIHARLCFPHLRHIHFLLETRHSTWTTAEGAPLPLGSSESAERSIGDDIPQQDSCHRLLQCSKVVAGDFWLWTLTNTDSGN